MPIHECINYADLQKIINNYPKVIIKLSAPWCGPCVRGAPIFEKYSNMKKDYKFVNINIDLFDLSDLSSYFGREINSIPLLICMRRNKQKIFVNKIDEETLIDLTS